MINVILLRTFRIVDMISNQQIYKVLSDKKVLISLILIGLITKLFLLPIKTGDYIVFLEPWIEFIKTHGYFSSLKYNFYDYTPTYIYILILIAKTGSNPLFLIKIISILFEYAVAFFIGKIAILKTQNKTSLLASLAIVPVLPSVILNSSYLSQCDSIYATFVVASLYFILKDRQFLSTLLLGIAFAFKMQTAIILPVFFVLMLRKKINWYYFLLIPIIFIISILPTWLYGRNFSDLLEVYMLQTNRYPFLTLNFPNIYIWIDNAFYEPVKLVGIVFTTILTIVGGLAISNKKYNFSFEQWIRLAFLSSIIIPFFLPGMHERYMYLGDILGILYFLVLKRNSHLPLAIASVSFYSYIRCSRFNDILPMYPAFIIYFLVIILVVSEFIIILKNESSKN
ncbi:MAG: hypothetical protein QM800_03360 [Paludibacter sp.]